MRYGRRRSLGRRAAGFIPSDADRTLAELAETMRVPYERLDRTTERWNVFVQDDDDPDFGLFVATGHGAGDPGFACAGTMALVTGAAAGSGRAAAIAFATSVAGSVAFPNVPGDAAGRTTTVCGGYVAR